MSREKIQDSTSHPPPHFKTALINLRTFVIHQGKKMPETASRRRTVQSMRKGTSTQNRRRRKRRGSTCLQRSLDVSSNTLSCVSLFSPSLFLFLAVPFSPLARRDIWCRPLPQSRVPSAISSALKPLQLQTPTVSSPLFHPALLRSLLSPSSPHRLYVPSTLSLIFPFRSLRFSPSLARASPSPSPLTGPIYICPLLP